MAAYGFKGSAVIIGVSLFERLLLNGRLEVVREIRHEFRFRPEPPLQLAALNGFGNVHALPDQ